MKAADLKEVQSRLDVRKDRLITMHDAQVNVATELKQLCMQATNRTSEFVEVYSAAKEDGRSAKRAKVGRGSAKSLEATLTAAYLALLSVCDEFKCRCEALMLDNWSILEWPRRQKSYLRRSQISKNPTHRRKVILLEGKVRNAILSLESEILRLRRCLKKPRMHRSGVLMRSINTRKLPLMLRRI